MRAAIDAWFATLPKLVNPALRSKMANLPPKTKPAPTPAILAANRARAFTRWDKNKDGVLTLDEYTNGLAKRGSADARFKNFDKNRDGKLTREEFVGRSRQ